jgi:hypothetical protein
MKFLTIVLLIISFNAFSCTQDEAIAAENVVGHAETWEALEKAFVKFKHCDDGSIGQGFSDSVAKLLAHEWEQLDYLQNKPRLYKFVLSHIDETWGLEQKQVLVNALNKCPVFAVSICKAVVDLPTT